MNEEPMTPGKSYWIKTRAKLFTGTVSKPTFKLNINTFNTYSANTQTEIETKLNSDAP